MERAVEAALAGEPLYPDDAEFVPSDLPALGRVLDRCMHDQRPVVLVFPDGHEHLLPFDRLVHAEASLFAEVRAAITELLRTSRDRLSSRR